MPLFSLADLAEAFAVVRSLVPPTPAYAWPLLEAQIGIKVFVKHENHTLTGAFKVRGGLVYLDALRRAAGPFPPGVVTATRGNHGQSVAVAAKRSGIPAVIVVPEDNSPEKNAAMRAFGAELVVAGADFDESRAAATRIAEERGFHFIPAFHHDLVKGVATGRGRCWRPTRRRGAHIVESSVHVQTHRDRRTRTRRASCVPCAGSRRGAGAFVPSART